MPKLNPYCIAHAGYLWKSPPLKKQHVARWKYRYFVLYDTFTDVHKDGGRELELIYYENDKAASRGEKYIGSINLLDIKVLAVSDKPVNGFPFVLRIVANDRTWFLCTKSYDDFTDWIAELKERTDRFVNKNTSHIRQRSQYGMQRSNSMSTLESSTTGSWSAISRDRLNTTDVIDCIQDPKLFPDRFDRTDDRLEGNVSGIQRSKTISSATPRRSTFVGKLFQQFGTWNKNRRSLRGIEEGNDERDQDQPKDKTSLRPSLAATFQQPFTPVYDPFENAFQGPTLKSKTYQRERQFAPYDMGSSASTPNSSGYSTDLSDYHDSFKARFNQELNNNQRSHSNRPRDNQDNISRSSSSGSSNAGRSPVSHLFSKRQLSMIQESRLGDDINRFETDSDTSSKYHEEMELPSPCGSIICQNDGQGFGSENESVPPSSHSHSTNHGDRSIQNDDGRASNLNVDNAQHTSSLATANDSEDEQCRISRSSMRSYRRRRSCEENQITRDLDDNHPVFKVSVAFSMDDLSNIDDGLEKNEQEE
ncbi:uncharacterized protein [Clytia hemisphaerica]|uniref:PH domain-containing protein n=1 Tax=Clytia hemisphaerica TaxID=252671 RepID=A0A7M5UIZ2_9CNID